MITELRDWTRADRFLNDVRANQKKRRNWGRYVYLAIVIVVFGYLANLLFGQYFWLRANGMVVSDHVVVASPYEVQITDMLVQPGDRVRMGQIIAKVRSPQVIETVARLTAQAADTNARQAEIAVKLDVANAVMKTANQRLAQTAAQLKQVNAVAGRAKGAISPTFIATVSAQHYDAMQEQASREAERKVATDQLADLRQSQADAKRALDDLRATYNSGNIVAPADGIVGPEVASRGDVIPPGQQILQLYVGRKFAYVYLDTGAFYRTEVGDRVAIADGFTRTKGTLVRIMPLSVQLPIAFQTAFRAPRRGQVAKIRLDDSSKFPLLSTVEVTGDKLIPGNDRITRSWVHHATGKALATVWSNISGLFGSADARAASTPHLARK
jgi:multidrug resistance efflux pump